MTSRKLVPPPSSGDAPEGRAPDLQTQDTPGTDRAPLRNWTLVGEFVGQDAVVKRLEELIGMARTLRDCDEIEGQNAERIGKITGIKRSVLTNCLRGRRELIAFGKVEPEFLPRSPPPGSAFRPRKADDREARRQQRVENICCVIVVACLFAAVVYVVGWWG